MDNNNYRIGKPYLIKDKWLNSQDYYELLQKADAGLCINKAPVKPKPGEMYIYKNDDNKKDWRCDQHRWRHKGVGHLPVGNPIVTCQYFSTYAGRGFQKRAYTIYNCGGVNTEATVAIHYVGSLENVIHTCHANRKNNKEVLHVTSTKEQLTKQKRLLDMPPNKTYKKLCVESMHPLHMPTYHPRNKKQVVNTIRNEQEKKLLSSDDIYGLYLINTEFTGYVSKLELLPNFVAIFISKEMTEIYKSICETRNCILYYDTTFNLGDFYVSPLAFTVPIFSCTPTIPLAYLIHHHKNKESHIEFFVHLKNICPEIQNKIVVTDREHAITHAIGKILPQCRHFYCWNHIQQDVKNWVKKQKNCEKEDIKTYVQHTWDLLDSDSEEDFNFKYARMQLHWSKEFQVYFNGNVKSAILKSGKWNLVRADIYVERSGVTINPSESLNAVLKRFLAHQEVKVQILSLTLYQLDKYYLCEIMKGLCDTSAEYVLRSDLHEAFYRPAEMINWPISGNVPVEKLPFIFNNQDGDWAKIETPYTKYAVAKMMVIEGRVRLVPEQQCFIVSSDTDKYVVTLYPSEKCSCKARKNCHHIKAAQLSIGKEQQNKKNIKLSTIIRKNRGYKSGRKRVPKNIKVIESADDSATKITGNNTTTLMIPTIIKGSIKHRFYDPDLVRNPSTSTPEKPNRSQALSGYFANISGVDCKSNENNNVDVLSRNNDNLCAAVSVLQADSDEEDFFEEENNNNSNIKTNTVKEVRVKRTKFELCHDYEDYTFTKNFKNNKVFTIYGRQVRPSDLECIVPTKSITSTMDYYFSDTILDVYFAVLISALDNPLSVFPVEGFILNYITFPHLTPFRTGLQYALNFKIPEKNIAIFPIIKSSHCVLLVVFQKLKIILYLNSLYTKSVPDEEIQFILKLYTSYYSIKKRCKEFNAHEWKVYVPNDIPQQTNSYDCGAYCCLYTEVLLTGSDQCITNFYLNNNMYMYRKHIKSTIIDAIRNSNIPAPRSYAYNKKNLDLDEPPNITIETVFANPPYITDTV